MFGTGLESFFWFYPDSIWKSLLPYCLCANLYKVVVMWSCKGLLDFKFSQKFQMFLWYPRIQEETSLSNIADTVSKQEILVILKTFCTMWNCAIVLVFIECLWFIRVIYYLYMWFIHSLSL